MIRCEAGNGDFRVTATAVRCGGDLSVSLCGGTQPHIGAVALAQYEPERDSATVSTIAVFTHRDDAVAAAVAKELAAALKCTVTVSVGLHVDDANAQEIAALRDSAGACAQALRQLLEEE